MAKTIRTALGCAIAILSLAFAASAEPYHRYRRAHAYGNSPAYWGVEPRVRTYRDCCGWRWTLLNAREASIPQLAPHLRARSDGRLLEEVGTPPHEHQKLQWFTRTVPTQGQSSPRGASGCSAPNTGITPCARRAPHEFPAVAEKSPLRSSRHSRRDQRRAEK